jgi:hypothetical protein
MFNSQVHGYEWNIHARTRCNVQFDESMFPWFCKDYLPLPIFLTYPQVVDSLLDITKTPRKPQYKMAAELPLILRSCQFDKANFMCSSGLSC